MGFWDEPFWWERQAAYEAAMALDPAEPDARSERPTRAELQEDERDWRRESQEDVDA